MDKENNDFRNFENDRLLSICIETYVHMHVLKNYILTTSKY